MMKQKWQALLNYLEFIEDPYCGEVWDEQQIINFELQNNVVLPADYKDFCQVFGGGMFGDYMQLWCPSKELQLGINVLKIEIDNYVYNNPDNSLDLESLNKLLSYAFVFGDNSCAEILFWNLESYSNLDNSCDIYLVRLDSFEGNLYQVGRNFFEFVCDFCLGTKAYEVLPEWMHPYPQELHYTFTQYRQKKSNSEASDRSLTQVSPPIQVERERGQVSQNFLQSAWEQLTVNAFFKPQKFSAEFQQIQQKLLQVWNKLIQSIQHSQTTNLTENTEDFNSQEQQAWQNFEQFVGNLAASYPQTKHFSHENFEHLHLPPESTSPRTDLPPARSEIEYQEMEEALRGGNFYAFFRYLRTFKSHSTSVYSVVFSPDGQILASGCADTTIKLWDLSNRQEIRNLTGHTDAVISVAISSDGQVLASGSADATIKLWNLDTSQEIYTLSGHSSSVLSVAISSNGQILASGSADRTIKLWNVITGQQIRTFTSHDSSVLSLAISPDGKILASGSADRTIKLWDLNTGEEIRTWDFESGFVFAVCFHPNGQMLFSSHEGDRTIKLWNLLTQEVIYTIPTDAEVVSLVISPDGQILAGGGGYSGSRVIGMWEVNAGKALASFHASTNNSIYHHRIVYSVAFSPDGQTLASGSKDTTVKLWGVPPPIKIE
ncbi:MULTISPECIES: WD40 domain-containing protein [unclassified Microcoleus]|uniref:WD40 domain-containing protein n=1 Tax=unclassified Microcoleus TaxID=2642155 RepID=UPI002FD4F0D8